MSPADRGRQADLDALLAEPTPGPVEAGADPSADPSADLRADHGAEHERHGGAVGGRLAAWLRGGSRHDHDGVYRSAHDEVEADAAGDAGVRAEIEADVGLEVGVGPWGEAGQGLAGQDRELRSLAVADIEPNRYQPRREFDEEGLEALARSVAELGVLQPVLVRPLADGRYELIAGERRWRASARAGMRTIPALIQTADDRESLEQAIVENLHRSDLSALEEAAAYQELIDDFRLTQEDVSVRVGKSRSAVANTLRLLQLPAEIQRLVQQGLLTAGHARALLTVDSRSDQVALAERVIDEEWSVRKTEQAAKAVGKDAGGPTGGSSAGGGGRGAAKSVGALEVEKLLEDRLETRVEVQEAGRGGRLVIRFADGGDLTRIARELLHPEDAGEA